MDLSGRRLLVTGGAGFVGSHLADRLFGANEVVVADDRSIGRTDWVPSAAEFVEIDLRDRAAVADLITDDLDAVFHLAAGKDVNDPNPREQFEANTTMTYNVLEAMADAGVTNLAFTSSSTVYGEAERPTPETAALEPISVYGASKVAEESLCSVYAHSREFTVWAFRFANIVGRRLTPGQVMVDFIQKLQADPSTLEILGDGRQEKSYMHIDDCVDAMCYVVEQTDEPLNVYNLGTESTTAVRTIADIVADAMDLDPDYVFTGGDRGWVGDVPKMRLAIERLVDLGWEPELSSTEAVERATGELVRQYT